jgi:hypothetical protein
MRAEHAASGGRQGHGKRGIPESSQWFDDELRIYGYFIIKKPSTIKDRGRLR